MARYSESLLARARGVCGERGLAFVLRYSAHRLCAPLLACYYNRLRRPRTFDFMGAPLAYFYHRHNTTWLHERAVEIPVVRQFLQGTEGLRVLEVGNVLSHYARGGHDVLDKYESSAGVINEDVVAFEPAEPYDVIVSISTLEHVGVDEPESEPEKVDRAIRHLRSRVLAPGGMLVFTVPVGHNPALDRMLGSDELDLSERHCFQRVSKDNRWIETSWEAIRDTRFHSPFPFANGLVVGVVRRAAAG